ncbi:MAG: penicillin-binding protein 2 [Oscillospiraceae bacterium]|nr:penicillin-binding protein 2 [Oscillospiraceae bacterium]
MYKRLTALGCVFMFLFAILYMRIYVIVSNPKYYAAAKEQGTYTLTVGHTCGNIYDRDYELLVNDTTAYYAAVNPTAEAAEEILPYVKDLESYHANIIYGKPFVCEVTKKDFDCEDITVFEVPVRNREKQLAQHIVGYTDESGGVSGIELAYDEFLRGTVSENSVTYNVDGRGGVLDGLGKDIKQGEPMTDGVVLTIDKDIQAVCELAGSKMEKGAVVVMDIQTGDILGMASFPSYSISSLSEDVSNENSPLINRCLYSYNVGSIFKLVTALAAFEQGLDESFTYICTGVTEIGGQPFKCHNLNGHGVLDMTGAMTQSCNTYFIELAKRIDNSILIETAKRMGFGRSITLATGMTASGGTLQTEEDLLLPAEKANMSFGQGKLNASPVQICAFTAAIANEGKLYVPGLVRGITHDGETVVNENEMKYTEVFDRQTAFRLQDLMIAAVDKNEDSNARPANTHAAGKTSTAQTGRFDDDGEELCHGWITGFFPLSSPKYAVTVLCEDGGYGNDCAAPVFREIAERITALDN